MFSVEARRLKGADLQRLSATPEVTKELPRLPRAKLLLKETSSSGSWKTLIMPAYCWETHEGMVRRTQLDVVFQRQVVKVDMGRRCA